MEGGVIQQSIEGMGTSDDVSLWLVASFSEFAPEARKMERQREKQQQQKTNQWGFLTCRLCLHFTWLTCRLCLQLIHTFPSNFVSNGCLLFSSKRCFLNAAFVCTLSYLIAVFLTIYYLFSIILATCFRPGFLATCSN